MPGDYRSQRAYEERQGFEENGENEQARIDHPGIEAEGLVEDVLLQGQVRSVQHEEREPGGQEHLLDDMALFPVTQLVGQDLSLIHI